jgi:hypothetical protein
MPLSASGSDRLLFKISENFSSFPKNFQNKKNYYGVAQAV